MSQKDTGKNKRKKKKRHRPDCSLCDTADSFICCTNHFDLADQRVGNGETVGFGGKQAIRRQVSQNAPSVTQTSSSGSETNGEEAQTQAQTEAAQAESAASQSEAAGQQL